MPDEVTTQNSDTKETIREALGQEVLGTLEKATSDAPILSRYLENELIVKIELSKTEGKDSPPTELLQKESLELISKVSSPDTAVAQLQTELEQRTKDLEGSRRAFRELGEKATMDETHLLEYQVNSNRWRETLARAALEEATARENGTTRNKGELVAMMEIGDADSPGFKALCQNCTEVVRVRGSKDNNAETAVCSCGLCAFSAHSYDNETPAIKAMGRIGPFERQIIHIVTNELSDEGGKVMGEKYVKTDRDRARYDKRFELAAAWTDPNR